MRPQGAQYGPPATVAPEQGWSQHVSLLRPQEPPSRAAGRGAGGRAAVHVDRFEIDYREDGSERQFSSDLSVVEPGTGRTLSRQHISVNKPLRWGGVTGCAAQRRLSCRSSPHARSRSAHQGVAVWWP